MDNTIKPLSRLLLLILLMSGLCLPVLANCSLAKGVYAPSAPEFTLDFVESSYYVPPSYKIDQYTGKNVTDKLGYNIENKSLVITIQNQAIQYSSFHDGTKYYMAYNVAVKGHFGEEWKGLDFVSQCTMKEYLSEGFPRASDSAYTVLYVPANNYPVGTQLDVKVQAHIGYESVIRVIDSGSLHPLGSYNEDGIIFDTAGDWSEIQTITINVPTPVDQLILTGALILIPIAAGLVLLIYLSKRKHSS